MPFITRRTLPAATLWIAFANAQACYYPDGQTLAPDIPCDPSAPASSCCGADSFCVAGGMCFGGGILTRGSCTDKSWGSGACSPLCQKENIGSEIAITPCTSGRSSNSFVCGVDNNDCQNDSTTFSISSDTGIILRPSQITALVGSVLSTAAPSALPEVTVVPDGLYSGVQMAGLAIGIAVPLLVALVVLFILLRREKRTFSKAKLMYKLPDELSEDFAFKPPPPVTQAQSPMQPSTRSSHQSAPASPRTARSSGPQTAQKITSPPSTCPVGSPRVRSVGSPSIRSMGSPRVQSSHSQTFLERYETMKRAAQVQSMEVTPESHEMERTPYHTPKSIPGTPTDEKTRRYELSDTR